MSRHWLRVSEPSLNTLNISVEANVFLSSSVRTLSSAHTRALSTLVRVAILTCKVMTPLLPVEHTSLAAVVGICAKLGVLSHVLYCIDARVNSKITGSLC